MNRWWRLTVLAGAAVLAAAAATVAGIALNVATGGAAPWFPTMERYPRSWLAGSTLLVAGSALLGLWAQRFYERGLLALVPVAQRPEPWVVDRPTQLAEISGALRQHRGGATVGITTAVHGAGGFGKTTVARLVRCDRAVLRRFRGRVFWVTLGRDARGGVLVEKVNDLVQRIDPARAQPFTDLRQAAEHLAAVLADGPRRLVILDDLWFPDQLDAFPVAGRCARLVTTRTSSLVGENGLRVKVDQMSPEQARRVLTANLPHLPPAAAIDALLAETGYWPLLLRLVNKIMLDQLRSRSDADGVAEELFKQLRQFGPLQVDRLTGGADQQLDINDPDQRDKTVAATIEASTGLLTAGYFARFTELAIFVEDETVPIPLVARLWRATDGLDDVATRALCARLEDLALVTLAPTGDGTVSLHDVVRDYLVHLLGEAEIIRLNRVLLDAVAADLPPAGTDGVADPAPAVAWWDLPEEARYLWDHLVEHLLAAGRAPAAESLVLSLRWIQSRLETGGPLGPFADLTHVTGARVTPYRVLFGRIAHLLTPTEPRRSVVDILYDRVARDPGWGPQVRAMAGSRTGPRLTSNWPLSDVDHPALLRTVTCHSEPVSAVAVAADGTWLASGGADGAVRVWDVGAGTPRGSLTGHQHGVLTVAIAADGSWLASGGADGTVRVWDPGTGVVRASFAGHQGPVRALAIVANGTWFASGGADGTIRIQNWDTAGSQCRNRFTAHAGPVTGVAISPDGHWLVSGGHDELVCVWDTGTGFLRSQLPGHRGPVTAVVIAADGRWLASAGEDRTIRLWDATTGAQRGEFTGHSAAVRGLAVPADSTRLVSASDDTTVRLWRSERDAPRPTATRTARHTTAVGTADNGRLLAVGRYDGTVRTMDTATGGWSGRLTGHTGAVNGIAVASDASWLASAGHDGTVCIWGGATGALRAELNGHTGPVHAVAVAPDAGWLASAGHDGTIRTWGSVGGFEHASLCRHGSPVRALAIARDGSWLAAADSDGKVVVWDPTSGRRRARLTGHHGSVNALAVAADGTWLASAGDDGTVHVWDVETWTPRHRITGHSSAVRSVTTSADGCWLVSGSSGGSIRVWDAATTRPLAMTRVDSAVHSCVVLDGAVVAGGATGLYSFQVRDGAGGGSPRR